jgi:serine/threonine protein kinase/tetratricopeptide (TPR) repeat protein
MADPNDEGPRADDDRPVPRGAPDGVRPVLPLFTADSPTVHVDIASPPPLSQSPFSPQGAGPPTPTSGPPAVPPAARLIPGDLIDDGRYRIESFLGEGGMGAVYAAADLELGQRVALKTLRPESAVPDALDRFKREINVARRVTHPSVCRLYDLGRHRLPDGGGDLLFLTMQFLEGETLRERVKRQGPLTTGEALPLARQMAAGLDAAHHAGVIHRDFKSGNVMLVRSTEGGRSGLRAVITDFGLAREVQQRDQMESLTVTAGFVGTPAYASPEQIQGKEVGPASDIYAFGIVLYEMLTGRLPFDEAPTAWMAVVKRLSDPPTPPRKHVPGLDTRWEEAILRCLERRPEDRFATGDEVMTALETPLSIQLTVPVPAMSASTPDPGAAWVYPTPPSGGTPYPSYPAYPSPAGGSAPGPHSGWPPGSWPAQPPWPTGAPPPGTPPPGTWGVAPTSGSQATGSWPTSTSGAAMPLAPARRPWLLPAIAAGALLIIALAFFWIGRASNEPDPAITAGGARRTVAVLGLKSLSGKPDAAWLATALTEMLAMEVAAGDSLRVIPGEQVTQMKSSLQLADADSYSAETLKRIHTFLGSDLLVVGSYLSSGASLRLDLRLQDARSGETVARLSESGKESDLIPLVEEMGDKLRREMGMAELTAGELQRARAAFPDSAESARLYAEGLAHLHRYELGEARTALEQAAAVAPRNPLVHATLADALWLTGNEQEARRFAEKAVSLAGELGKRERLAITARQLEMQRAWPQAIATLRQLRELYPDDIEYGLALGRVQNSAGAYDDSLATFAELERLPPPAGDDPRIAVLKVNNFLRKGEYDRGLAVAEAAAAKGRARGAKVTEGSAYAYMGVAREFKGQLQEALLDLERARATFEDAGYREGASATLSSTARVLTTLGDFAGAETRLKQAIEIQRQIGVTAKLRSSLAALSGLYLARGDLRLAREKSEECLRMSEGSELMTAEYRKDLAKILLAQGELAASGADSGAALRFAASANDQRLRAMALSLRGDLALQRGELEAATKDVEEALSFFAQAGNALAVAEQSVLLARIAALRGEADRARRVMGDVLAQRASDALDLRALQYRLAEAEILTDLEDQPAFERALQQTLDQLASPMAQQVPPMALRALTVAIRLELAAGNLAEARAFAVRADQMVATIEPVGTRLRAELAIARALATTGARADQAAAASRARRVHAEAELKELRWIAEEADLALGAIELRGDDAGAGRTRLRAVRARAQAAGWQGLARRADRALDS